MKKKQVYTVALISRSIQTKLVYASSKKEAKEIADDPDMEWNEKEQMLDSEIEVNTAVLSGNEKKGAYPDFYPSDYVWTGEDCVRYNELKTTTNHL